MAYKFEIHKDKSGQFRVRFKYRGEVIFSTEAYTTKASAQKAIKSIREKGPAAPVDDLTLTTPAKAPAKMTVAKAAAKPVTAAKAAANAVGAAVTKVAKTSTNINP